MVLGGRWVGSLLPVTGCTVFWPNSLIGCTREVVKLCWFTSSLMRYMSGSGEPTALGHIWWVPPNESWRPGSGPGGVVNVWVISPSEHGAIGTGIGIGSVNGSSSTGLFGCTSM